MLKRHARSFVDIAPHLGVRCSRKHFGARIGILPQIREILKLTYYRNYCIDRHQILHGRDPICPKEIEDCRWQPSSKIKKIAISLDYLWWNLAQWCVLALLAIKFCNFENSWWQLEKSLSNKLLTNFAEFCVLGYSGHHYPKAIKK